MFDDLDHQIEGTVGEHPKTSEKLIRIAGIALVAVLVFGGLITLIMVLE